MTRCDVCEYIPWEPVPKCPACQDIKDKEWNDAAPQPEEN